MSNGTITILVDNFSFGTHQFNVTVYDLDVNANWYLVTVTVVDTSPPIINSPEDFSFEESSRGNVLECIVGDLDPHQYEVTKNGTTYLPSVSWINGTISLNLDRLTVGFHNFTKFIYDGEGNEAIYSVIVHIFRTPTTTSTKPALSYSLP